MLCVKMFQRIILIATLVATIGCLQSSIASANHLRLNSVPAKVPHRFTDAILPDSQRTGTVVENLGQVMLLDTYSSPKSTNKMSTKFNIFNRRKSMKGIKFGPNVTCTLGEFNQTHGPFEYNLDLMLQSSFNIDAKTIVMVPGYLSHAEEPWIIESRESWLDLEDVNVIEVSWSDSNRGLYSTAVAHTPLIARQITIFLYYLAELSQRRLHDDDFLDRIHLIGHSLGAHIVGFVGQDLDGRAGRITGLDPAGPSFDQFPSNQRLDRRDAKLVEILHTNSGKMKYMYATLSAPLHAIDKLLGLSTLTKKLSDRYSGEGETAWYGIDMNVGHIDYYANNGRVQPGCSGLLHICDHNRATDIFVEILRYERQLRQATDDEQLLRQSRLLAFRADNYDNFTSGSSFNKHCPAINSEDTFSSAEVSQTIQRCSIPLDLMTPANELIEELERDYHIDFFYSSPSVATYYFKTLDDGNLVGDHYLLKIFIRHYGKNKKGSFRVSIQMPRGEVIELHLDQVIENHESNPIAVPFAHSGGALARLKLNNILVGLNSQSSGKEKEHQLRDLLPRNIEIQLVDPKSKGVMDTVKDLAIKMIKSDEGQSCDLIVDSIEVQPISGAEKNFAGIYGSQVTEATTVNSSESDQNSEDNQGALSTLTPEQLLDFRRINHVGCLTYSSGVRAGLKAIVIG